MLSKKIILIVIFLTFINNLKAQELNVDLIEEFIIGDDENAPDEYLFYLPTHITTDSKCNFYIADYNMSKIRMFNNKGEFIKYIGRKGQGPGEIQEVTCMTVDHNDDLIVVDRMNRRFTRFSTMGNEFKTYMFQAQIIDPWQIFSLGTEKFIIYHRERSKYKSPQSKNTILHVYNKNFTSILESFANSGDIWNLEESFLRTRVGKNTANMYTINPAKILFVPGFYENCVYLYENKNNTWHLKKLRSDRPYLKSYKLLKVSDYLNRNYDEFPPGIFFTSGPSGRFAVLMQNISKGIFIMNNGIIVHFYQTTYYRKNKFTFGVEFFETNGNYIGYSPLCNYSLDENNDDVINDRVLWKDKDDRFYVVASKNDFPIIRVMRLKYKIRNKN